MPPHCFLRSVRFFTTSEQVSLRQLWNLYKKQKIDKQRYDDKHRDLQFQVGDKVRVFYPIRKKGYSDKLQLRYFGPKYVVEKDGVNYMIANGLGPKDPVFTKENRLLCNLDYGCLNGDADSLHCHLVRYRPEQIHTLESRTKFTRKEIQLIYRGFKQECPTGMVDEESFTNIFSQFFPLGDATAYAHYVFGTVKQKHTGKINFEDFLDIMSRVSRGTVQEKLQWVFGLYDLNGDGQITKKEMIEVTSSIYDMLGTSTEPSVDDNSAKEHIEKIFHLIDTNKDGIVTIDDMVAWCSRNEHMLQSLKTLDTIL